MINPKKIRQYIDKFDKNIKEKTFPVDKFDKNLQEFEVREKFTIILV